MILSSMAGVGGGVAVGKLESPAKKKQQPTSMSEEKELEKPEEKEPEEKVIGGGGIGGGGIGEGGIG